MKEGIVQDAAFTGIGCAIPQAPTLMMIELVKGKADWEIRWLNGTFLGMIKREIANDDN